jgi:hypothetical protein
VAVVHRNLDHDLHPAPALGVTELDVQVAVLLGFDQGDPAGQFVPLGFLADPRGAGGDLPFGRVPAGDV